MAKPIPTACRADLTRLLDHLKTCPTLAHVNESLLAKPPDATRPGIGLVGYTPRCAQLFMGPISLSSILVGVPSLTGVVILISQVALNITGLQTKSVTFDWQTLLVVVSVSFVLSVLFVAFRLRYWVERLAVSWRRGLFLDLDELSHLTPLWQMATPWGKLYTATPAGDRRLKVVWEDRTELWVWFASCCDRDLVQKLMRELMRLHHTDRHGQLSIPKP